MTDASEPRYDLPHSPVQVNVRALLWSLISLAALITASMGLMFGFVSWLTGKDVRISAAHAQQLPDGDVIQVPLNPQQLKQRDEYEARQKKLLATYGWQDQSTGVAHIPIERAMELTVENYKAKQE